jgi:trigger factor
MKTTVSPLENSEVKLSVSLETAEWDGVLSQATRSIAGQVRIPGFRPGKAPRGVLEARFGKEVIREEALRRGMPEYYAKAVAETELDVVAAPTFDVTSSEDDDTLSFDATVMIRPSIMVPGYSGLAVKTPSPDISDEDFERQVDRFRAQFADLVVADRAAIDGDILTIDIETTRDGEIIDQLTARAYSYELGSKGVVPELDEKLAGVSAGDIREFAVTAADDLPLDFKVTVTSVNEKVLPELTDEWVVANSEFTTVQQLRDDLRKRLTSARRGQVVAGIRDRVLEALIELVAEDVPQAMLDSETDRSLRNFADRVERQGADLEQWMAATGRDLDDLRAELRDQADKACKADLALRAVADGEDLQADNDEVDIHIEQLAARMGEKPVRVKAAFERNGQIPSVRADVRKGKALDWLMANVTFLDDETGAEINRDLLDVSELEVDAFGRTQADEHYGHDHA